MAVLADKDDKCALIKGPAHKYCERGQSGGGSSPDDAPSGGGGLTDGASDHVKDLADTLIRTLKGLIAPKDGWTPEKPDNWLYEQFMWLGQHLAVSIFICVVVVCGLTAWQGAPRLKQMGASTGWTLVAIVGMASVPGAVMLLNEAVSAAFTTAFDSDQSTLFNVIREDLGNSGNPLANLIIISALVVALAFAALVFMTRQLGILVFVCIAPLVLASLARGGDMSAVKTWAQRLLGLMFAPFALLVVTLFVPFVKGSLVMEGVLLVVADLLMLRMVFHGVPYIGPRLARAAGAMVEKRVSNPTMRRVARAGVPDFYEQENTPRGPRTVMTPGRAIAQDGDALAAAYGLRTRKRPGRMTTASVVDQAHRDGERQSRVMAARREARAAHNPSRTNPRTPPTGSPAPPPPARTAPPASGGSGPASGGSGTP